MADSLLTDALRLDPTQSSSFLMMARIGLERDDVEAAEKALDEALAKDFEVRKNPYYFFIQSFVLESKDRVEDAKDALKKALQVPRFESVRNAKKKKKSLHSLSLQREHFLQRLPLSLEGLSKYPIFKSYSQKKDS